MPDIPKTPVTDLNESMHKVVKASHAVKAGIATHTQKHVARQHAQRARVEAERKLITEQ